MGCGNSKLGSDTKTISNDGEVDMRTVINLKPKAIPEHQVVYDKSVNVSRKYVCTRENNEPFTRTYSSRVYKVKFHPRITVKYDVIALIGKGSYSRVVRAVHRLTKQSYAIKVIGCKEGREMFETELAILRRVKHPYVIQLIEVLESNDSLSMVMELATGGDLFDRIVSCGNFSEHDASRVLYMVLDGVQYLHSLGITHRDLKPDNLLYSHPGNDSKILITDFGLANIRQSGGNIFMNTACGTPEYIAPEIVARKPYTNAVDLWAIGVIAFILLSGTFPFDDDNHTRLYKLILKAKYSYHDKHWLKVSQSAINFIDRLLVVESSKRMTATEALSHPWINNYVQTSSVQSTDESINESQNNCSELTKTHSENSLQTKTCNENSPKI